MTDVVKPADCRDCKHYRKTAVFELCTREQAAYTVAEKIDQHTIGHMRGGWVCGPDAKLFEPQDLTSADVMGY